MKTKDFTRFFVFIFSFLFLSFSIFAESYRASHPDFSILREFDWKLIGPHQRQMVHAEMTRLVVKLDGLDKKENFKPNEFSFNLESILNSISSTCYASGDESCLFGGWISVRRGGSCKAPWDRGAISLAESESIASYNTNGQCGHSNLFRCNPTVFGPGLTEGMSAEGINVDGFDASLVNGSGSRSNPAHGICVTIDGSYNGISRKCHAVMAALDERRQPSWRNSDFFEQRAGDFQKVMNLVADRCEQGVVSTDGMCNALRETASQVMAAGLAGEISDGLLTDMGLECVMERRNDPSATRCNQDGKGPALESLYQGLGRAMRQANCRTNLVIGAENQPNVQASSCTLAVTSEAMEASQSAPENGRQTFKIYYTRDGETHNFSLPVAVSEDGSAANAVAEALLAESGREATLFQTACADREDEACLAQGAEGVDNLREALTELGQSETCPLSSVTAHDEAAFTDAFIGGESHSVSGCQVGIGGALQSQGLKVEQNVVVSFNGMDNEAHRMTVRVGPEMSKDAILSAIREGANEEAFQRACAGASQGACGSVPSSEYGQAVMSYLARLRNWTIDGAEDSQSCNFDNITIVPRDEAVQTPDAGVPAHCGAFASQAASAQLDLMGEEGPNSNNQQFDIVIHKGQETLKLQANLGSLQDDGSIRGLGTFFRHDEEDSNVAQFCLSERVRSPAQVEHDATVRAEDGDEVVAAYGLQEQIGELPEEQQAVVRENILSLSEAGITPENGYTITLEGTNLNITSGANPGGVIRAGHTVTIDASQGSGPEAVARVNREFRVASGSLENSRVFYSVLRSMSGDYAGINPTLLDEDEDFYRLSHRVVNDGGSIEYTVAMDYADYSRVFEGDTLAAGNTLTSRLASEQGYGANCTAIQDHVDQQGTSRALQKFIITCPLP